MNSVEIYTKSWCTYCRMAKMMLEKSGVQYQEYDVTNDHEKAAEMRERSGGHTVPQIFINDRSIGGFTDLAALSQNTSIHKLVNSGTGENNN